MTFEYALQDYELETESILLEYVQKSLYNSDSIDMDDIYVEASSKIGSAISTLIDRFIEFCKKIWAKVSSLFSGKQINDLEAKAKENSSTKITTYDGKKLEKENQRLEKELLELKKNKSATKADAEKAVARYKKQRNIILGSSIVVGAVGAIALIKYGKKRVAEETKQGKIEKAQLEKELGVSKDNYEKLNAQYTSYINRSQSDRTEMQARIDDSYKQNSELKSKIDALNSDKKLLQGRLASATSQTDTIKDLEQKLKASKEVFEKQLHKTEMLEKELAMTRDRLTKASKKELDDFGTRVDLKSALDSAHRSIEDQKKTIEKLTAEIKDLETQNNEKFWSLDTAKKRIRELEQKFSAADSLCTHLDKCLSEETNKRKKDAESFTKTISNLTDTNHELKRDLRGKKGEIMKPSKQNSLKRDIKKRMETSRSRRTNPTSSIKIRPKNPYGITNNTKNKITIIFNGGSKLERKVGKLKTGVKRDFDADKFFEKEAYINRELFNVRKNSIEDMAKWIQHLNNLLDRPHSSDEKTSYKEDNRRKVLIQGLLDADTSDKK